MRDPDQQVSDTNDRTEDRWARDLAHHISHGADLPVLLMTTAHSTGNLSVLRKEWRPVDVLGVAKCDVSEDEQDRIKEECAWLLADHRRSGGSPPGRPTYDFLRAVGDWFLGSGIEPYIPLLAEELVFDRNDLRRPLWSKDRIAPGRSLHVAIVGAGESGIILGVRLKQAGVPFTIYEKNTDVGGTWLENGYPGCRVDINSFVYSYASVPHIWPDYFGMRGDVLSYLQRVAKENGLYEHIRFGTEIEDAAWNEGTKSWTLTMRSRGQIETVSRDAVIFAVGQLNRPKLPDIPGVDIFGGASLVVHGGSIVMFSELTAKYILDALRLLLEKDERTMDVRPDVFEDYNQRIDDANRARAWGFSKVNSWYKDARGRVGQNYPFTAAEYYQRTDSVVKADFNFGTGR